MLFRKFQRSIADLKLEEKLIRFNSRPPITPAIVFAREIVKLAESVAESGRVETVLVGPKLLEFTRNVETWGGQVLGLARQATSKEFGLRRRPQCKTFLVELAYAVAGAPNETFLTISGDRIEAELPNRRLLQLIAAGNVIALDATAPRPLLEAIGFETKTINVEPPRNVEILARADKLHGTSYAKGAGSTANEEVVSAATDYLGLPNSGAVLRKKEAAIVRERCPKSGAIYHYGAVRGTNVAAELGVSRLLVGRYCVNPKELEKSTRRWRLIVAVSAGLRGAARPAILTEIPVEETVAEEIPFLGTHWARRVKLPRDPIARELYYAARCEMIQAIGRLRPYSRPDEKLQVVVMDGEPIPGVRYDALIEDSQGNVGGEAAFHRYMSVWQSRYVTYLAEYHLERARELEAEENETYAETLTTLAAANEVRKTRAEIRRRNELVPRLRGIRREQGGKLPSQRILRSRLGCGQSQLARAIKELREADSGGGDTSS
jgi:hypothetical protein